MGHQPRTERLQRGIQLPGELHAADLEAIVGKIALKLEYVAQVVGTGKAEAAVSGRLAPGLYPSWCGG